MTDKQTAIEYLTPFEIKCLLAISDEGDYPNTIGGRMWTENSHYKSQGLARMAGKFLHRLDKKGYIRHILLDNGFTIWGKSAKGILEAKKYARKN